MTVMHEVEYLTDDECDDLAEQLDKRFAGYLKDRFFTCNIEGQDETMVHVKVILSNDDESYYYPVEGRILYKYHGLSKRDGALLLLDYIDGYFDEYLREEDIFLPIDWADFEQDGIAFQLKGQVVNLKIERMADELLK